MEPAVQHELLTRFDSKLNSAMRMYLDTCARCGVCIQSCHVYASMPELKYTAVHRAEVIRKLFKRHFKVQGRVWPSLGDSTELTDDAVDTVYQAAYSCTGCRRCMVHCPFGIDTQMIMSIAKLLLLAAGREPKVLSMLADMSIQKGKSTPETRANFAKAIEQLRDEVLARWREDHGDKVVPLDVQDANILYVALAGKHSIVPAAAIMNAAGEKWSLSYYEAVNFGAFVGNPEKTRMIAQRIIDEAVRLRVKEVSICECGTAYRVMRHMMGALPFRVTSFTEVIARYLREGRITLARNRIKGRITYHDPCQLGRNGGVIEEPRYIFSRMTDDFVELEPNRAENWCCGGGGGLVAIGEKDFRMRSAKVKADQIKAAKPDIVSTACENCHSQLTDITGHYQINASVRFLSDMVAESLQA
jgi:Fe-S oxidoreductase